MLFACMSLTVNSDCDNMKIASVLITYLVLIQVSFVPAPCQEPYSDDHGQVREMVLDHSLKTVQLFREGWPLSYPVIRLSGRNVLMFSG